MFVVECELSVEPVGVGHVGAIAAGERFPDRPEAVDVCVVGKEDRVSCGESVRHHLCEVHPEVDRTVRLHLQGASARAALVAKPVWLAEEQRRRGGARYHVSVHEMRILPPLLRIRAPPRALHRRRLLEQRHAQVDNLRTLRARIPIRVVQRLIDTLRRAIAGLVGVKLRDTDPGVQVQRGVIPVPEREREGVLANEVRQNALVEVDEEAVPRQEQPALVNLQWILLALKVESVVTVGAVQLGLIVERPAVAVGQRTHELVRLLDLGGVGCVHQIRWVADPEWQVGLELEFHGWVCV